VGGQPGEVAVLELDRAGLRKPMAVFMRVVLPMPFLPSSATASPSRTSSETPKRIGVAP